MSVLGQVLFFLLSLGLAALLASIGHALFSDRNGIATRRAARWTSWRLDRPAEEQPVRRRQTFEQALRGLRVMGGLLLVMAGMVVLLSVIGLFSHS